MSCRPVLGLLLAILAAAAALAFETPARIKSIDVEKRVAQVFAGGQDRSVPIAADARILDEAGKELPGGLRASQLKEGATVTLTVERENGGPVIKVIRLGGAPVANAQPQPRVDTTALKPLVSLGNAEYHGYRGGLYPGASNQRPPAHEAAGISLARQVQPLDAAGKPSADGKIVLLSVGMSNTTQEFSAFKQRADGSPEKNPRLVLVDGAQGGMTAAAIQNAEDQGTGTRYWSTVDQRLKDAGVTRAQVQAAWLKEADAGPRQGFPGYAQQLKAELVRIVQLMSGRFPNLKLVYLSSRTYGGYAKTPLNPEPYAYESGFSVKWLIEQQIQGDASLNPVAAKGAVRAPWLSWGPYLWANGTRKNPDGLAYEESDFGADGTHPSPSGRAKVADALWKFFNSDTTTEIWFKRH